MKAQAYVISKQVAVEYSLREPTMHGLLPGPVPTSLEEALPNEAAAFQDDRASVTVTLKGFYVGATQPALSPALRAVADSSGVTLGVSGTLSTQGLNITGQGSQQGVNAVAEFARTHDLLEMR